MLSSLPALTLSSLDEHASHSDQFQRPDPGVAPALRHLCLHHSWFDTCPESRKRCWHRFCRSLQRRFVRQMFPCLEQTLRQSSRRVFSACQHGKKKKKTDPPKENNAICSPIWWHCFSLQYQAQGCWYMYFISKQRLIFTRYVSLSFWESLRTSYSRGIVTFNPVQLSWPLLTRVCLPE